MTGDESRRREANAGDEGVDEEPGTSERVAMARG